MLYLPRWRMSWVYDSISFISTASRAPSEHCASRGTLLCLDPAATLCGLAVATRDRADLLAAEHGELTVALAPAHARVQVLPGFAPPAEQ